MNKWRLWMTAVLALVLVVPFAEAKGAPSFKGGFSSHKSAPKTSYKSSPKAEKPKNSFGSFQKNSAADASPQSASGADLSQAAAKQNAWNTYKSTQQNKANDGVKPNGHSSGWNASGGNTGGNGNNAGWSRNDYGKDNRMSNQPGIHHTTINNHSGGGFMHGLMWFMIGQSWGNHHSTTLVQQSPSPSNNENLVQPSEWNTPAPVEEQESALWGVLRLALWIGFLWAIIVVIKKMVAIKNAVKNKRYSLRSF